MPNDHAPLATVAASGSALAPLDLVALAEDAKAFLAAADADNTRKTYASAWADFAAWCAGQGAESLPAAPEIVAAYFTDRARTLKVASLQVRKSAIARAHHEAGQESPTEHPTVRGLLRGIRRTKGTAPEKVAPAVIDDVRAMVAALPKDLRGLRDRAVILLGFAGAFRRSELAALELRDLAWRAEGLLVTLRRSKTDQEGAGAEKGIPFGRGETCPVQAVRAWVDAAGITEGPLFRGVDRWGRLAAEGLNDRTIARTVQSAAEAAGLDGRHFAGHSLRAGFATTAAAAGVEERAIQSQTGHRSVSVLRGYIRLGSVFRENAAGRVGL